MYFGTNAMKQEESSDMIQELCHKQLEEFEASYDSPSTDVRTVKQPVLSGSIIEELFSKQLEEFKASYDSPPTDVKTVEQPVSGS